MRRIVVAFVVLSMTFVVAGCGGAEEPAADTAGEGTAPVVAPVADATPEVVDRSPVETGYPVKFPGITSVESPAAIQQKLDDGQPMVLFFYDGTQLVTKDQRTELDAALAEYRGLIDLVSFNVASSTDSEASADAQIAAAVASDLGVSATPYILLVDGNGFITWRYKGYVDREVIGREVLRATE